MRILKHVYSTRDNSTQTSQRYKKP